MKTSDGLAFELVGRPARRLAWVDRLLRRL